MTYDPVAERINMLDARIGDAQRKMVEMDLTMRAMNCTPGQLTVIGNTVNALRRQLEAFEDRLAVVETTLIERNKP